MSRGHFLKNDSIIKKSNSPNSLWYNATPDLSPSNYSIQKVQNYTHPYLIRGPVCKDKRSRFPSRSINLLSNKLQQSLQIPLPNIPFFIDASLGLIKNPDQYQLSLIQSILGHLRL